MINKVVRVNDIGLIQFFYPQFKIKDTISISDYNESIIYKGPSRRGLNDLLSNYKNDIS